MAAAENMVDTEETNAAPKPVARTPIVQLVWDVAQLARQMARVHEARQRPDKKGRLHFV
jgi:hypothetical protein